MVTKSNRHKMVEVECEQCATPFMARKQRVEQGLSRFCSRKCYGLWQREKPSELLGKENARTYFDKAGNRYIVRWVDEETGKGKTSTWSKWAWEMNFGEIPEGYRVGFKDNDATNISLDNLYLQTYEDLGKIVSEKLSGVPLSDDAKKKLSEAHTGKTLSEEHKKKIGDASRKAWANGVFDEVHIGKYNKNWRGGVEQGYPREFKKIVPHIKDRDNYMCQICGEENLTGRRGQVHHISGNRDDNSEDNLILLCTPCHNKVHAKYETSPVIMTFREKLEWYDG